MKHSAIHVDKLSKRFRLGEISGNYSTLRESIADYCGRSLRRFFPKRSLVPNGSEAIGQKSEQDLSTDFWALREISFDVEPGEIVGVVGRNGAGKSTFLKILSRISPPTSGKVDIRGRVGSLLEVGTGFHPELSGRENIFLNGAILGMSRKKIARDFDAIVDFAEIERFLDTPVKRYSSGMYVRLAFSIATHLEPEVLIVDEVLAVGDTQFQKKCLGRMEQVRRSGRTVLFVSHNMSAVRNLCSRGILLDAGRIKMDGPIDAVVEQYLDDGQPKSSSREIPLGAERITSGQGRILRVSVTDLNNVPISQGYYQEPIRVYFECELYEDIAEGLFEVSVCNRDCQNVLMATTIDGNKASRILRKGLHKVCVTLSNVLLPKDYYLDLGIHHASGDTIDYVPRACSFEVLKLGKRDGQHYPWSTVRGSAVANSEWTVQ